MPDDPYVWASPDSLVAAGYAQDDAERAVLQASWVLWALSGRQLHGQGTRIDTYRPVCNGRHEFYLSTRPVRDVLSVETVDAWTGASTTKTETTDWIHFQNRVVTRFGVGMYDRVVVTYTVRSNLPPLTHTIVLTLAEEYLKAAAGESCALPERVTSITRQGVSWTLLDPADFLDKNLLGVIPIDSWLTTVNPRRNKLRVEVFDPRLPRLLSSTWILEPFDSLDNGDGTFTWYGHGSPEDLSSDWLSTTPGAGDTYIDVDTEETYTFPL